MSTNETNMSSDDDDSSEFIDDPDMYEDEDAYQEAWARNQNKKIERRESARNNERKDNPYLINYYNTNVVDTTVKVNIPKFEFESLEYLFAFFHKIQRKYNTTLNQNTQWFVDNIYSERNIGNHVILKDKNKIIPEIDFIFDSPNQTLNGCKIYIGDREYDLNLLHEIINTYSNLFPTETRYIPFFVGLSEYNFEGLRKKKNIINHRNCLVYDKKEKKAYYYEPHGSYFDNFDSKWVTEKVFCILYNLLKDHGIEVIPPYVTTPYVNGLQSFDIGKYKKNELKGYCMLWSSFIIFILHYTNLTEIDTSLDIHKIINSSRMVYTNNRSTDNLSVQRIIQGFWLFLNNNKVKEMFEEHETNLIPVVTQIKFYVISPFYKYGCYKQSYPLKSVVRVMSLNKECRDKKLTIHYVTTIPQNTRPNRIDLQKIDQTFGSHLMQENEQHLPETYEEIYNIIDTTKTEILRKISQYINNNNSGSSPYEKFMKIVFTGLSEKKGLTKYEKTYYQQTTVLLNLIDLYEVTRTTLGDSKTYEFGGVILNTQLFLQIINFLCSSESEGIIYFPYNKANRKMFNDQMIYFINYTIEDLQKLLYAYNLTHDCKYHVEHELTTDETEL